MLPILHICFDIAYIVWTILSSVVCELLKSCRNIFCPSCKDLSNDIVLITGAGSGIGRLMCLEFSKCCTTVIGWDINDDALNETARMLAEHGHILKTYVCDLRDRNSIMETARRVLDEIGRVTILVNNAGVVSGQAFLDLRQEDIESCFKTNVFAHFYTTQAFLPHMITPPDTKVIGDTVERNSKGHIVNVVSVAGVIPGVGLSDYCASKAASLLMSESLELELVQRNLSDKIHVTCICPFLINTKMFAGCQPKRPWLFPIVDPDYCARRIVQAVRANERQVYVSSRYALLPIIKSLFPQGTLLEMYKLGGSECFLAQLQAKRIENSRITS